MYCPPTNLERLGFARLEHGLSLCARRVLVQSDCRELVPEYLRFLRGLVDSEDLPLNVSRETLQDNNVIRKIRTSLVKAVLDRLDNLAQEQPDVFRTFYDQFGRMLKEGLVVDPANRERIAKLLRFPSTRADDPTALVSFDEYIARMPEGQTRIYYLGGPDLASIRKSPNLEIFRRRGLEVMFLTDPIDEFAINSLGSYQGKELTSIDSADLDLPETSPTAEPEPNATESQAKESGFGRVLDLFRNALGDSGQRSPRVEAIDRQPLLPGQCGGEHEHPDAEALETHQQRFHREPANPRGQSLGSIGPPALPLECQSRARRIYQAMRRAALGRRDDP